ncbi:MAG TPA: hypothetical protein VF765_29965 [Polyangiaceae bacterium]
MDGDIFGAVTRLGRDAAEGVARAVHGDAWDPFLATRCIEVLVEKAEGIRSLPAVLEVLRTINATPLLASVLVESSLERVDDAVREANGTELDLILRSSVQRSLLRGEYQPGGILQRFCAELLDRSIISGRGGFLELANDGQARRDEAMAILAPVAARAAQVLEARPDAKRLGLSRQHARLSPKSDLLGGPS